MRALLLPFLCAFGLLAAPLGATWSILIVNVVTGEVAVGIATCLTGFDLRPSTIVVVPEVGVAAAQSFVGPLRLRQLIRDELIAGRTPAQILAALAATDGGHQTRQYGIVDAQGRAATFTGTGAFAFANGLTGQVGDLHYAIQGNVLTGAPVLQGAEAAIRMTPGDVGQRLMAAMEAARAAGGDGRCSCNLGSPTACGSPPASFQKSAHIGLVVVSRPGDVDRPCSGGLGCGAGDYYLDLNVRNQPASAQDPVLQLQALYASWRAQQAGRPDHVRSTATASVTTLRANARDRTTVVVRLFDIDGQPVGSVPTLTATVTPGSVADDLSIGPITARQDGSYVFDVTAGRTPGLARLDLRADDGTGPSVLLAPRLAITVGDPFGACGAGTVADGTGGRLDLLEVNGASGGAGRVVPISFAQPFTIGMRALPAASGSGPFVGAHLLWLQLGRPLPGLELPIGLGGRAGTLCSGPAPFVPGAPSLLLTNSFGGGLLAAPNAPWTATLPGIPAVVDFTLQGIVVENAVGELATTNAIEVRIEPLPAPTLVGIAPAAAAPGAVMTVTGSGFVPGATAAIDGRPVPLTSLTPTAVTFDLPTGAPTCDATLEVRNPSSAPATLGFNGSPTITSVRPPDGVAAGGTSMTILGSNLDAATVTVGGAPLVVFLNGPSFIIGTTPPGTVGPTTVRVEAPSGCAGTAPFTYR